MLLYFQNFDGLTEVFDPGRTDIRLGVRGISGLVSAGYPAPKMALWALFHS